MPPEPNKRKRGSKGVAGLKAIIEEQRALIAVLQPQIEKKECDYENRQRMEHSEIVLKLKEELDEQKRTGSTLGTKLKALTKAFDINTSAMAAERVAFEGTLMDAAASAQVRYDEANAAAIIKLSAAERSRDIVIATKERMILHRDAKLEDARILALEASKASAEDILILNAKISNLETLNDERLVTIKRLCGRLGGRPNVSRNEEELDECVYSTAKACTQAMAQRFRNLLGEFGTETEISTVALMKALVESGYLHAVWESEDMWDLKMEWANEKRDDLSLAWDANLTCKIRDTLVISYDKVDELRYLLSHHRVGKQLRGRTWLINPWNGRRLLFPQPIRPRCGVLGWTRLVGAMQARLGLRMDKRGRVAQRSFASTVASQFERDEARGLLRPITPTAPLIAVLGADGTGVGKRSIMHVASSIAPTYRDGVSVENEKNIATVATSVTSDHWGGLNETMCGGCFTGECDELPPESIAGEVNSIISKGYVAVGGSDDNPAREVPTVVTGCFDLVAARGIRGGRGRCACHTETPTADRFDIPPIKDDTTWEEAKAMLEKRPMLRSAFLRDDSHTPPADWDYVAGPWKCKREGCSVQFESDKAFRHARVLFLIEKVDKSAEGKKLTAARAKRYAELHPSEQEEFQPPCTDVDMEDIIIDPLHCLLLNLPKVAWKYVFGDRMTNEQRELVAEYLASIECPLDVRDKKDGRDANRKWFSGEVLQRFVEGGGASPGLAENIVAIMDIIYVKAPKPVVPDKPDKSDKPDAPTVNKTARQGGGGAKKRKGGHSAVAVPAPANAAPANAAPANAAPANAHGNAAPAVVLSSSPADDSPLEAKLRARYGSHMDVVKLGLNVWKEYGLLYAEWREVWESNTQVYAEERALNLLRCAVRTASAMKDASLGKHKSWYYFLTVWVVPRQMAKHHDLWAYGTAPVEQRGARLKKFVRNVVSWRPYHDGWVDPVGPVQSDGTRPPPVFVARRKYESCAMMQVLRMCVAQEEMWAAPALDSVQTGVSNLSVSERRMQTVGRTTLLKVERGKGHRLPFLKEEVIDLC